MTEVTTSEALSDPESSGQYSAKVGQDIVKGWNDRRKASNIEISGLTPFVQLIGLFDQLEVEKMFSFDITTAKRKVYFDDGNKPSSLGDPQPAASVEELAPYEDIQRQLDTRSINVYFSGSRNPQGRGAPVKGIILAETRSQADPGNYEGGVGISDLQIDYGKSSAVGSRTYKLRLTVNDPHLINERVEYSKLATMNGEFVILYGWTNPRGIPNYDALPVPAPEPDPADGKKNRIVIPLNGAGTGGYWQAAKANILSYDFSFNEMGHIEIAVSMLDKTSLALASQKVGPIAPFMKKALGADEHNSQAQETGQPNYPSGGFDQIQVTLADGVQSTVADAIKSNQDENKRIALETVMGMAGYAPEDEGMTRFLNTVDTIDVNNTFAAFGLSVEDIIPGTQEATPAESQQVNMQETIRRDKEKQLREFPYAGTGVRVYEEVTKYVQMDDDLDEDTGEPTMEEVPAYNIKTTHYYMGWLLETMKLGMQDVNKHKIRMGETPAIPNFTYLDNPDADQISNVFQDQQSAKQLGPMSQRIQDAIIRLKEKCIPPFKARTPDHDIVSVVGGAPENALGNPINFEVSPCKNKVVIENVHEILQITSKSIEDLIGIMKEKSGLTDADLQAMQQPRIEGESFRGHVLQATVTLPVREAADSTARRIGISALKGREQGGNVEFTLRAFIPDPNFDPANPTDYDITKSRLYDPTAPGPGTTMDTPLQAAEGQLAALVREDLDSMESEEIIALRADEIFQLKQRIEAMKDTLTGEGANTWKGQENIIKNSAQQARQLGYVGASDEDVVRGQFFFFLRCEWRKAADGSKWFGAATSAATMGLGPAISLGAGALASGAYKEYWKTGQIVGRYKIVDPDEARMYVNWDLIQRRWYNLHVKSLTTHIEQLIYKRVEELERDGMAIEEIYLEPVDLDWLTGYNFNWNSLISDDTRIKTYNEIKGNWMRDSDIGDTTHNVQQRIDEYDKDINDLQTAIDDVSNKLRNKLNFIERQKEGIERKTGGRFDRVSDFEGETRMGDNFYKFDKFVDMMAEFNERREERGQDPVEFNPTETIPNQPTMVDEDPAPGIPIKGQSNLLSFADDDNDEPPLRSRSGRDDDLYDDDLY